MLEIDKQAVEYWDRCFYDEGGVFYTRDERLAGSKRTSVVLDADPQLLRRFAIEAHTNRAANTPGGHYNELDSTDLSGKEVLDFGCGSGIEAFHMAQRGAIVTICDIVPSNIQLASRILEPYPFNALLLESYNDIDTLGTFDIIFSFGCLHHIRFDIVTQVISLLKAHLRPSGFFLIMVYTNFFYPKPNYWVKCTKCHAAGWGGEGGICPNCGGGTLIHQEGPYAMGYNIPLLAYVFGSDMGLDHYRVFNNGSFMWAILSRKKQSA